MLPRSGHGANVSCGTALGRRLRIRCTGDFPRHRASPARTDRGTSGRGTGGYLLVQAATSEPRASSMPSARRPKRLRKKRATRMSMRTRRKMSLPFWTPESRRPASRPSGRSGPIPVNGGTTCSPAIRESATPDPGHPSGTARGRRRLRVPSFLGPRASHAGAAHARCAESEGPVLDERGADGEFVGHGGHWKVARALPSCRETVAAPAARRYGR